MPDLPELPTTQRAYTLRLRGPDNSGSGWRKALWATHYAVNKGAKVFGEWLLSFRGGLDHNLADQLPDPIPDSETPESIKRNKRILLGLSWLSVEDKHGAPNDPRFIVAHGSDSRDARERLLAEALASILEKRGISPQDRGNPNLEYQSQPGTWLADCMPSLSANIRDDAVWVNRCACFDDLVERCPSLNREEIWDFFKPFFNSPNDYFGLSDGEEKDLVILAGNWLSQRMGTGKGADYAHLANAYEVISSWANGAINSSKIVSLPELGKHLANSGFNVSSETKEGILNVIKSPGRDSSTQILIKSLSETGLLAQDDLARLRDKSNQDAGVSKSKIGGKGPRPYSELMQKEVSESCGFSYRQEEGSARHAEYSVMLDHAARRINVAHSWIKNAEEERKQFLADSQLYNNVTADAIKWLKEYCDQRHQSSGSIDSYRIRRRAIDAWDKVVSRWSQKDCDSFEKRVEAARSLQDDPEIEKFGDIQLFEALAKEDAFCVWHKDGKADPSQLVDFVKASEAEANRKRFKVPAYRHPDALRAPVFCDFGKSRWGIEYAIHTASGGLGSLEEKLQKSREELESLQAKLAKTVPAKQAPVIEKLQKEETKFRQIEAQLNKLRDRFHLDMKLWNGITLEDTPLRWSCKRLSSDLGLNETPKTSEDHPVEVSRMDRLGLAAGKVSSPADAFVKSLFEQENWNGRLQAPRRDLDAIAKHIDKHDWDARARQMIDCIPWLVSFSPKLIQQGPWIDYCNRVFPSNSSQPTIGRDGKYWVKNKENDSRKSLARINLARLPDLRILSVDLGHRYAAACAVWQVLSQADLAALCSAANEPAPPSSHHFLHLHTKDATGKNRTTIFRRIGPDILSDQSIHPGPWARLDRQFLIKLQGEDQGARKVLPEEITLVTGLEKSFGFNRHPDNPLPVRVDDLMTESVRITRLALAWHGRRATIAFQISSDKKPLPGGRYENLTDQTRLDLLLNTLQQWHSLASDHRWNDSLARDHWNHYLSGIPGGFRIEAPQSSSLPSDPSISSQQRKRETSELLDKLRPLAGTLARDEELRRQLHSLWAKRWSEDDESWRKKLKQISRWLMPRNLSCLQTFLRKDGTTGKRRRRNPAKIKSAFHVGGLSIDRIATLTEFRRKVQVGYFTRQKPDGTHEEIKPNFGKTTLKTIERLKEQRVKQLVSRIVEAALGIGAEPGHNKARGSVSVKTPRFAPCHAVVIEDLAHYRPEETRTRRENRATMDWKSQETRKRLEDHCSLHGLLLWDVNPQYTSRQDSRTGFPGVRCVDVPIADFLKKPWWQNQVTQAQSKIKEGGKSARDQYLVDLQSKYHADSIPDHFRKKTVRIPLNGGEVFVSSDRKSPCAKGLQADLNAAANIGLRALLDPDWPGRWWYIPAILDENNYRIANPEKCAGAACLSNWKVAKEGAYYSPSGTPKPTIDIEEAEKEVQKAEERLAETKKQISQSKKKNGTPLPEDADTFLEKAKTAKADASALLRTARASAKTKALINLWRNISCDDLNQGQWWDYAAYENRILFGVIQILRERENL